VTYAAARVLLLNNGAAFAYPREIEALALGSFAAAIVPAFLERHRMWFTGLAALCLAVFAFLTLPMLASVRLNLLHATVPIADESDPRDRPATCLCTTRGSLHELFGPPDFSTAGETDGAAQYAYRLGMVDSRVFVLYRLEIGQSAFDHLRTIEHLAASETDLRTRGLARWGSR
jgi:hypothetical protein